MIRLKLIWLALTAPAIAIHNRVLTIEDGKNNIFKDKLRDELANLKRENWNLVSISLEHRQDDFDIDVVERFLKNAPDYIERLIG